MVFGLNHPMCYSLKESDKFYNLYYYLRRYSHFYVSWRSRRSRGEALCVYSICAEILSAYSLLYLRVDTFGEFGEVFRAVGKLQDSFPRFLDLRRDSFRVFSTDA